MSERCHFTVVSDGPAQQWPGRNGTHTSRNGSHGTYHRSPADLREATSLLDIDLGSLIGDIRDLYQPFDQGWFPIAGGRYERRHGGMFPFFRSEQELDWLRSASRFVATYNAGHGAGFIGSYCGYIINKGHICKPVPVDGTNDPADMALVKAAERELQEFSDRTSWPEMQQELFNSSLIDGDAFLWLFDLGDHLDIRRVLPEYVRMPMGGQLNEWAFGRHTPPDDRHNTLGWHVTGEDGTGGDFVMADDMAYFPFSRPGGWDSTISRGLPIFMGCGKESADCAAKILRNMGEGVAVRQTIAWIEEQAEGVSREDTAADADFSADVKITDPIGNTRSRPIRKARPGNVPKVSPGYKFNNPPAHPETESAINVVDSLIRSVCAMLSCPAWMGGASGRDQGAYSAELVKDAPLVKTGEQRQEFYGNRFLKVCRRVLEIAVRCGRLSPLTLTRLRLTMEHPTMASQDPQAKAAVDQIYVGMGAKSVQQTQQELSLDVAKQRAEIAEFNSWKAKQTAATQPQVAPGGNDAAPGGGTNATPPRTPPLTPGISDGDTNPLGTDARGGKASTHESRDAVASDASLASLIEHGDPPRPGLVWNDATSRWHRPAHEGGGEEPGQGEGKPAEKPASPAKPKLSPEEKAKASAEHFEKLMATKSPDDAVAFRRAKADGIAIPPAWTEVVYHGKDQNVWAKGRDDKGRWQVAENPEYRQGVSDANNARITQDLKPRMGKLREQLRSDAEAGNEESKVLYLISLTGFRIGGKGDGKAKVQAYGASTLTGDQVRVDGDTVTFDFPGKKGVRQQHSVTDPLVARMMAHVEPGKPVFNTRDTKVREAWQNKYGGEKVHDIRHVVATEIAEKEIDKRIPPPPKNEKEKTALTKQIATIASHTLGNDPNQTLSTYIDPHLWDKIEVAA